jgi:acyl-CoA dehydrogenase
MIDFDIPADLAALRDEIRAFVVEQIVPYEADPRVTRHGPDDDLRAELVEPVQLGF